MIDLKKEVWRPWRDTYMEASSDGRLRSWYGRRGRATTPRILKPTAHGRHGSEGYLQITMRFKGKKHCLYVHRIVCEAFHGAPPDGFPEVRHLDGTRQTNCPDNLTWGHRDLQVADMIVHGTMTPWSEKPGSKYRASIRRWIADRGRHPGAKLEPDQVLAIRRRRSAGERGVDLAREYGVDQSVVCHICKRRIWAWLEEELAEIAA